MAFAVLDQFETEPSAFYSGSYTDNIFIGSFFEPRGRIKVASIVSGSNEIRYAQNYSDFLSHSGSNRSRSLGLDLRFRTFYTLDEQYQDTILPDYLQAYYLNGGKAAIAYTEAGLSPVLLTDAVAGVPANYPVGKLTYTAYNTTASYNAGAVNVGDNIWLSSFPFQGRYRDIKKVENLQMFRSSIICAATASQSASFDGVVRYGPNTGFASSSIATFEVIIPRTWKDGTIAGAGNNEPFRYVLLDVTGSVAPSGSIEDQFYAFGLVAFPPAAIGFFGVGSGTKRPTEKQMIKFIFGFGENYQQIPILSGVSSSYLNNTIGVINCHYVSSVDIRGWRYGVANGFPYYSSCVFRSGHYGQFRDMLEQRKVTKFYNPNGNKTKRGSTDAVVQITFVSGSQAFLSASDPSNLNVNDSGIYDIEYKSGQPWHDV